MVFKGIIYVIKLYVKLLLAIIIYEMSKKPRRIPEEKVFVTRKLSRGVANINNR